MKNIRNHLLSAVLACALATCGGAFAQAASAALPLPAPCHVGIGIGLNFSGITTIDAPNLDHVRISYMKPLTVRFITSGGPAAKAKIYLGDKIVAVDGHNVTGLTAPAVVKLIVNGPVGSDVVLTIRRNGNHIQKTIKVKRENICS